MASTAAPEATTNPLLDQAGLPKFSSIEPSNLTPAVTSLLENLDKDFAYLTSKISTDSSEVKYDEILPELEKMQFGLGYAWGVTSHLNGVKNSDELRKVYEENQPKVVKAMAQFSQSREVYDALSSIRASMDESDESFELSQKMRAVENSLRGMKLGGVGLDGAEKERFNEIRLRLAELATSFSNNVLDSTKAFSLTVEDPKDVENVPESAKAMWANAHKVSLGEEGEKMEVDPEKGPWRITLDMPSYIATMSHVPSRNVREQVYKAFITRASEFTKTEDGESKNNVPSVYEILKLKQERATLLGFNNHAEMSLASKMAPTVDSVKELSNLILDKALPSALRELDEITTLARSVGGDEYNEDNLEKLMPWDVTFWSERLKESKFDMKEEELRPYFALPSVLDGMFGLIERLFNVEVKKDESGVETWNPDVSFYNLYDKDSGKQIASFYLDPYSRPADKR